MTRSEPSVVFRALALHVTSLLVPVLGVLVIHIVFLRQQLIKPDLLGLWGFFAAGTTGLYWISRRKPNYWLLSLAAIVLLLSLCIQSLLFPNTMSRHDYEPRSQTVIAVVWAVTGGLALVSLLLTLWARRMVLTDLSPDIINSSLVIAFKSRSDWDTVHVTPDSIDLIYRKGYNRSALGIVALSYPLTTVTSVNVYYSDSETAYLLVPGSLTRQIRVSPGNCVEVRLAGGIFVFPAEDCEGFARLVEGRARALAGDK